ncbi:MAG: hypothetical protein NTX63_01955 [Candidatus Peregrinibacteria bacterium]|nr:hypothetical protein [Candidatus Peregrinibacteria bacterium]
MKFYQDFGFKWTAASTLVLASIFAMTSFSASAGAPIANPPGGNISPTFTNLTTATDVIVGKNLRIGDSIMPNSGTSFAIKADKVNFTKDVEVKGSVKTDIISSLLNYVRINGLQINKPVVGQGGARTSLTAYDAVQLAASDALSFGFGSEGLFINKGPNGSGKLTTDGDLRTKSNAYVGNDIYVSNVTHSPSLETTGISATSGLPQGDDITLDGYTTTVKSPQFTLGSGVEFNSDFLTTYSGNTPVSAFTGNVGVGGDLSAYSGAVTGYNVSALNGIKAKKAIGAWYYPTSGNRTVSGVNQTGAAAIVDSACIAPAKIVGCEAVTADPLQNIEVRARVLTGGLNTTCYVIGMSKTAAQVTYAAQATCFDPSQNN